MTKADVEQTPRRAQRRRRGAGRASQRRAGREAAPSSRRRAPASGARAGDAHPKSASACRSAARPSRKRLVEAQQTAAMLTTFNEVDMSAVMALRERQKEAFKDKHGVGLGIASFFVKAAIAALREFPRLNAEIQGDEMVLKHYYDIGVAVGAAEGLVVPVLRDADRHVVRRNRAGASASSRRRRNDGTLTLDDLRGGTFSITNGGVFGSLMSTPILNPPQVGILGLHAIKERPDRRRRPGRAAADDVHRAHLRPPHRRRRRGRAVPRARQGAGRGSRRAAH